MANKPLGNMIIELGLDSAAFGKGLDGAKKAIQSSMREMKAQMSVLSASGDQLGTLEAKYNGLSKTLQATEKQIDALRKAYENSLDENGNATESTRKYADELNMAVARAGSLEKQIEDTGRSIDDLKNGTDSTNKLGNSIEDVDKKTQKASGSVKSMVQAFGLVKVAGAAFDVLRSSMDGAISRFDTFQKFPKVLGALNFEAEQSTDSVNALSAGIDGLPTTLDDVVSTAQRMTAVTGNLDKSTDATIALNNAMLASGASTSDASRGMEQYIQMLSTGVVDMQSWRSLQETMPVSLQKVAEALNYTQTGLYDALKSGEIAFSTFQDKLIELGTGTGILAQLARDNSEGIATSFSNLAYTATKGLASVLETLDQLSKEVTGKSIAKNLDSLKGAVNTTFTTINSVITATTPVMVGFASTIKVLKPLTPVLYGLAAGYVALKVIQKANNWIDDANELAKLAITSSKTLTIAKKAEIVTEMANTDATIKLTLAKMAQNGTVKASTLLVGVMTKAISLSAAAEAIATAATTALKGALTALAGPVGWVVGGITALVGVLSWNSKESKKAKEKVEEQTASYRELNEEVASNKKEREKNLRSVEAESKASDLLVDSVEKLTSKTKLDKAERTELTNTINQLNQKYEGLNLQYNEETELLNQSIELIKKKTKAYQAQNKFEAYNEMILENQKESIRLSFEEEKARKSLSDLEDQLANKTYESRRENKEAIKQTTEALEENIIVQKENAEEYDLLMQGQSKAASDYSTAVEASNAAIQESNANMTINLKEQFEGLNNAQQDALNGIVSSYETMVDQLSNLNEEINTDDTLTWERVRLNQQETIRKTQEFASLYAQLIQAGVSDSYLNAIGATGPEAAPLLQQMLDSGTETVLNSQKDWEEAYKTIKDSYVGTLEVDDTMKDAFGRYIDSEAGITGALKTTISGADFGSLTKPITDDMAENIAKSETVGKAAAEMINKIPTIMSQEFPQKNNAMKAVGGNLVDGLANGIIEGQDNVETITKDMATAITQVTKKEFGVRSPSTVFKDIGTYLTDGLALGVIGGIPKVLLALEMLTVAVSGNSVSDRLGQSVGSNISTSIITGIQSKAGAMMASGSLLITSLSIGINATKASAVATTVSLLDQIWRTSNSYAPKMMLSGKLLTSSLVLGMDSQKGNARNKAFETGNLINTTLLNFRPTMKTTGQSLINSLADGIRSGASAISSAMRTISGAMLTSISKGINGSIGGVNFVLSELGSDKKLNSWAIPAYAKGTKGHPEDGPALINDGQGAHYQEAYIDPDDGRMGMFPKMRNVVTYLKKGTQVIKGSTVAKMKKFMPAYAKGIGDFDIFDYLDKPGELVSKAISSHTDLNGVVEPWLNMTKSAISLITDAAGPLIEKELANFFPSGGGSFAPHFPNPPWVRTSGYGARWGKNHNGIDFGAPMGTPIPNQYPGRVVVAGPTSGFGNWVGVQVAQNMTAIYGHMRSVLTKVGDYVKAGQTIALNGSEGESTGPHVHYELREGGINGRAVDPDSYGADSGGGLAGTGVDRWVPVIHKAAALSRDKVNASDMQALLHRINKESGGNEKIVQSSAVWDVNMANGNPARGLLQYIPQTFNAWKRVGYGEIMNGFHQLMALFNDSNWRSDIRMPGGWGPTGRRRFENGGFVTQHGMYEMGEGNKMEMILPMTRKTRALELMSRAKQILGVTDGDLTIQQETSGLESKLDRIIHLLTLGLNKNSDVYMDSEKVGQLVEKSVSKAQTRKTYINNAVRGLVN